MSPIMNANTQARFQEVLMQATNGDIGIGKVADILHIAILQRFLRGKDLVDQDIAINDFLDIVERKVDDT